ncbi:hypothetical protein VTP01DRAFT_5377 [Rhizomucor pusillus]|uniref:uncharacterized protein n=1 Tax=Rhizomucor pusillus TaxID=4840 RepID=UPI0037420881
MLLIRLKMRKKTWAFAWEKPRSTYILYIDQNKVRFSKLMFAKVLRTSTAAKQLGIHVRMAQMWTKRYQLDSDNTYLRDA